MTTPDVPTTPMTAQAPAPATLPPRTPPTTDVPSLVLSAALAIVLGAAGFANFGFGQLFPSNAPIEQAWAFGISVDLWVASLILTIRFAVLMRRARGTVPTLDGPGKLAMAAAIISAASLIGWLPLGGAAFLADVVNGDRLRYYLDVSGAFFLGFAWVTGLVLGVVAYRRDRGLPNAIFCAVAILCPLVIAAMSLFSAVVYGLGFSD